MLEKGLKHTSRTVVLPDNFALAMGSGDLPVLATPALVALMENAAMLAVAAELPEGTTTVGVKMDMTHVRPSGGGEEVYAEATLVEVEGRKLTFSLVARDSVDVIGEGTHIRYIVDRTKFLSKLKG
ncbi:thioesterase family protein [Parabacteroides johnsonii]|uniref:thioesterase family protein n=1 Tax=Parabacteroides johnsonii TaxID=387661 RepID=UPI003AB7856B